jgi:hypothetical protein
MEVGNPYLISLRHSGTIAKSDEADHTSGKPYTETRGRFGYCRALACRKFPAIQLQFAVLR